jgi:hypothetical protein
MKAQTTLGQLANIERQRSFRPRNDGLNTTPTIFSLRSEHSEIPSSFLRERPPLALISPSL